MNVYIDMALSRYFQSVAYFFVIFFPLINTGNSMDLC